MSDPTMQRLGVCAARRIEASRAEAPPQLAIMPAPAQESEIVPIERGSGVARDQRGLGEKSSGAAHRVDERPALGRNSRPPGAQQHRGRHVLLQRRPPALGPVAAPMQALPREVDRYQGGRPFDVQVQEHVGPFGPDDRPFTRRFAQVVTYRIFQQLRAVDRVPDRGIAAAALAGQRRTRREVLAPIEALESFEQSLGGPGLDRAEAEEHPGRGARPEARAVAASRVPWNFTSWLRSRISTAPNASSSSVSTDDAPTGAVAIQ